MREAPAEGYNYIFGLRSSNMSTVDAADFAIKKTSAREVVFMVPVSRLTSLCFVAASSQGRRYPRLACSSWSNYRFGSSSCYINTIKKTSAREVLFMVHQSWRIAELYCWWNFWYKWVEKWMLNNKFLPIGKFLLTFYHLIVYIYR